MISAKNLIIVESPSKARTISKYLGDKYTILASVGHVKDLPKSELGIDVENDFKLKYQVLKGKKKILDELKREAKKSSIVYLAPDPDREGEAIAWHIYSEIKSANKEIYRIQFNEITKKGVIEAIKTPGPINISRVEAQQSRRILDRVVGYMVSPLLWKPLKYGLSAGRVQSVALRFICEREEEIEKFNPEEYWIVTGIFQAGEDELKARLVRKGGKKYTIKTGDEVKQILEKLTGEIFKISKIEKKTIKQASPLPFITARLQQDAYHKLGYSAKKTMMIAQKLYEGVDLGSDGPVGLITYMRTDSTRVSVDAAQQAKTFIKEKYGDEFVNKQFRNKTAKKGNVQDAHEAIRPTSITKIPDDIKKYLAADQYRLYKLIWNRFIASQMSNATFEQKTIIIKVSDIEFETKGKKILFPGFLKIYNENSGNDNDEPIFQGDIAEGDIVGVKKIDTDQNFTTPPPRYSEATLVKILEEKGIGRPSTYAALISTVQERGYVEVESKRFKPTELGRVVNKMLISNFPKIFDVAFTSEMEKDLDDIESGNVDWKEKIHNFYSSFSSELKMAKDKFSSGLLMGIKCPSCNEELMIKYGKSGTFAACSSYPECKFTSDFIRNARGAFELVASDNNLASGIECEKCGKELVFKKTRFGEILACPGYPECKNIKNFIRLKDGNIRIIKNGDKIKNTVCPKCSTDLVVKSGKNGLFAACSNYPKCTFTADLVFDENGDVQPAVNKIDEITCEKCGTTMVLKNGRRGIFFTCPKFPACKNTKSAVKLEDGTITVKQKIK